MGRSVAGGPIILPGSQRRGTEIGGLPAYLLHAVRTGLLFRRPNIPKEFRAAPVTVPRGRTSSSLPPPNIGSEDPFVCDITGSGPHRLRANIWTSTEGVKVSVLSIGSKPLPSLQFSADLKMGSSESFTNSLSSSSSPTRSPHYHPPVASPCAACKILRRRCVERCVLAPYFPPSDPQKFITAHRVFGASNIIKFLQVRDRSDLGSFTYENNLLSSYLR